MKWYFAFLVVGGVIFLGTLLNAIGSEPGKEVQGRIKGRSLWGVIPVGYRISVEKGETYYCFGDIFTIFRQVEIAKRAQKVGYEEAHIIGRVRIRNNFIGRQVCEIEEIKVE